MTVNRSSVYYIFNEPPEGIWPGPATTGRSGSLNPTASTEIGAAQSEFFARFCAQQSQEH